MSDFWAKRLAQQTQGQQPAPLQHPGQGGWPSPPAQYAPRAQGPQAAGNAPAWWQAPTPMRYDADEHVDGNMVIDNSGLTVSQLAKMDPATLSNEALELIAKYKLGNDKYNNHCPYCDSTNYGAPGNSLRRQSNAPARCFDCGFQSGGIAARMDNQLQPVGKTAAGKNSQHVNGGEGSFHGQFEHHAQSTALYNAYGQRPGF